MADEKQASGFTDGEETPMETDVIDKQPVDKTLRRTISDPSATTTTSSMSTVFSPTIFSSSYTRKSSLNGLETSSELVALSRMRPKSTSSCRSSSVSDDDQGIKLSPLAIGRRTRTCSFSDSLNVDCSSTSPSPIPIGSPAPRVLQIRREESVDEKTREAAKERDVTSAINLSRSWDETLLLGDNKRDNFDDLAFDPNSPSLSSPVRFIDKLQRSLTPSPIGVPISPNQRRFRRSLSPSSLRPSLLTSKRKLDPDDPDSFSSPAKRPPNFYTPNHHPHSVSLSSFPSSPDHPSDSNSNHCSCDEDSGSETAFAPNHLRTNPHAILSSHTPVNSPLSCETRHGNSFAFVKPRHVAPQSPLAAGVNSNANSNEQHRKTIGGVPTSYTFTPVKNT